MKYKYFLVKMESEKDSNLNEILDEILQAKLLEEKGFCGYSFNEIEVPKLSQD